MGILNLSKFVADKNAATTQTAETPAPQVATPIPAPQVAPQPKPATPTPQSADPALLAVPMPQAQANMVVEGLTKAFEQYAKEDAAFAAKLKSGKKSIKDAAHFLYELHRPPRGMNNDMDSADADADHLRAKQFIMDDNLTIEVAKQIAKDRFAGLVKQKESAKKNAKKGEADAPDVIKPTRKPKVIHEDKDKVVEVRTMGVQSGSEESDDEFDIEKYAGDCGVNLFDL